MAVMRGGWRRGAPFGVAVLVVTVVAGPAIADLAPPEPPVVVGPPPASWPAPGPIDAPAWAVVEAATGQVLAGDNVDVRRPVASTVKVLTALTALGRVSLGEEVAVGEEVTGIGGALLGVEPGDVWTVEELLDGLLARSGNDAAEALAAHVAGSTEAFVELMRQDAHRLGLTGTTLTSVSGLDDGNLLSAADLATIARAALEHAELRPLLARPTVELPGLGEVESRNELLRAYPGATGLKTGFTAAAGNTLLASAERDGRELIAVVLGAGDDPARFELAAGLLDHGFAQLEPRRVGGSLELAVGGGSAGHTVTAVAVTVPVGWPATIAFSIPADAREPTVAARLVVGDDTLARVEAVADRRTETRSGGDPADLGLVLVDRVYTALRASTSAGVLR